MVASTSANPPSLLARVGGRITTSRPWKRSGSGGVAKSNKSQLPPRAITAACRALRSAPWRPSNTNGRASGAATVAGAIAGMRAEIIAAGSGRSASACTAGSWKPWLASSRSQPAASISTALASPGPSHQLADCPPTKFHTVAAIGSATRKTPPCARLARTAGSSAAPKRNCPPRPTTRSAGGNFVPSIVGSQVSELFSTAPPRGSP